MSISQVARARRSLLQAVALLTLGASSAVAGGDSREVRVIAFQRSEDTNARFVIEAVSKRNRILGCRIAEVIAAYEVRPFWPWSEVKEFTREAYDEGLKRLEEASESRAVIRFGVMGSGLGHEPSDGRCVFRSRGLATHEEHSGTQAVFSVYKYP
jgi:hypothetical protein